MTVFNSKEHWENIYKTREPEEVSWYQANPEISLRFVQEFNLPLKTKIIDIGGGDSLLVDHLLDLGYVDITVLDISEKAIEKAKKRLGALAKKVKWIICDINDFETEEKYDFWHDRATFHFLTDENRIKVYLNQIQEFLSDDGLLLIGTFSESGPEKCSGLEVKRYSENELTERFGNQFKKLKCIYANHDTPQGAEQSFLFCSFKKSC